MCGFWDIADLDFSHLYFSCKNFQELAQARITKVVAYFTTYPTKLVFHFSDFSMIFYAIYKNQPNHKYYLSYPFAVRPSERTLALQCGPWARPGVVRQRFRPGIAGFRPREGGGVFYGPLGFGLGAQLEDRGCRRGCSAAPPCGVHLELASGELSTGAARWAARCRFSGVGRQGLGARETAESTVDKG
jgi:hypothetical protein